MTCVIKNSATLAGSLFTLHASQIRIELPTLSDQDKEVNRRFYFLLVDVIHCRFYFGLLPYNFLLFLMFQVISSWGVQNKIDFLSLSYTRHAEDVRQVIIVPHLHPLLLRLPKMILMLNLSEIYLFYLNNLITEIFLLWCRLVSISPSGVTSVKLKFLQRLRI